MIRTTVSALKIATNMAARATVGRNTIPILANLLLDAGKKGATLRGTDLDMDITAPIAPALVEKPMRLTFRAKPLVEALKVMDPDGEVTIEATDLHAVVRSGALTMKLAMLPADDYPTLTLPKEWRSAFTMPAGELLRLLASVAYAISTEETRYYLNGVYLHVQDGALAAVATDGHRLMLARGDLPAGAEDLRGEIIPRETVRHLRALLRSMPGDAPVKVRADNLKVTVEAPGWTIAAKMIDGTFPEYLRIIPAADTAKAVLEVASTAEVLKAIRQVRAVTEERRPPIAIAAENGAASLSVRSHEDGEAHITLPETAARWSSAPLEGQVGIQAGYLKATAEVFASGFTVRIIDERSPVRIEGKEGLAILMPMRI